MKQVTQRPRDGLVSVVDVPLPALKPGYALVATRFSLISAGTERSKVELGGKSLLRKARTRPDLVRKVVDRARVEGVRSALEAAREKLDTLAPLGHSAAGTVLEVGAGVDGLVPGDRIACGGDWAAHAEVLGVPRNLIAKVPDSVPLDVAAYATVGAIALHGVRRAEAQIGERVGVIGLGLVGQLALRILLAAGCEAVGIEPDPEAVELAERAGARAFRRDDSGLKSVVRSASGGLGLDAVLICAATPSNDPVELAARLARDRARLVVVGDVQVAADRAVLYEKELELRLSRSYGPGRYDRGYEEGGRDLPAGYVRWTEQRNLQAFLGLVASRRVNPAELTTHRFPIDQAARAYGVLSQPDGRRPFGVLLEYSYEVATTGPVETRPAARPRAGDVRMGMIGAGAFTRSTLIPALQAGGAVLAAITSAGGLSAADVAGRFGFERAAASPEELLGDEALDAIVIATRHSTHAGLAAAALRAGKAVFVEKPLALTEEELIEVEAALGEGGMLMVGFNRRFAPLVERLAGELGDSDNRVLTVRINAGPLPDDHWLHDPDEGGGRLLGEGCHFVDLLTHLAGSRPTEVHAVAVPRPLRPLECSDSLAATLRFGNNTVGSLIYSGSGDIRLRKERIEAFGGGLAAVLDDFRRLELYRGGKRTLVKSRQDKAPRRDLAVPRRCGRQSGATLSSFLRRLDSRDPCARGVSSDRAAHRGLVTPTSHLLASRHESIA